MRKEKNKSGFGKIVGGIISTILIIIVIMAMADNFDDAAYEATNGAFGKVEDLSDYADYTEDELAKALGIEKNATGMYPNDNEINFMCGDGKVYMIQLKQSHQNDSRYTLFGIKLGEAASNINDKISTQFDFIDSSYIDGGKRDSYANKKTGYGLAIDYDTNSTVISVSYVMESE